MTPQGPPKRRGRPRKDDSERNAAAAKAAAAEKEAVNEEQAAVEEEIPRMTTRRTTRRSNAANLEEAPAALSERTKRTPKKQQKVVQDEDETMVDVEEAPAAASEPTKRTPKKQQKAVQDENETMADVEDKAKNTEEKASTLAPAKSKPTPRSTRSKTQTFPETLVQPEVPEANGTDILALGLSKTESAAKEVVEQVQTLTNGTASFEKPKDTNPEANLGKVEFLARVHTSGGIVDIPLPSAKIAEEADLVQKYADWMATKGAAQVTFEVFRSIFAMSREG